MMKTLFKNREMLLVVAILALVALIAIRFPPFVAPRNLANVYNDTSILIILALGQMAVILTRCIDLSMAANLALSGGNQQKVVIAKWLATKPRVIILDEPTKGIDIGSKAAVHEFMGELVAQGLSVIMVSSELPEVLGMSDRIAVMHGGTVTAMLPGTADAHEVMAAALGQKGREVA